MMYGEGIYQSSTESKGTISIWVHSIPKLVAATIDAPVEKNPIAHDRKL